VCALIFIFFHGVSFAQDPSPDDWVNSGTDSVKTDKNVGIGLGTNTPSHKLDIFTGVETNVKTYNYGLETTVNRSGGWARSFRLRSEYTNAATAFGSVHGEAFISTGFDINTDPTGYLSPKFFIKSNGNVGIGTDSPGALLDIYKADSVLPATLRIRSKDIDIGSPPFSVIELRSSSTTDASNDFPAGKIIAGYDSGSYNSARLSFQSVNSAGSYVDTLSIKNGNVGIGTNDPGNYKLNIYGGNVLVDGAGYIGLMLRGTSASDLYFFDSGAAVNKKWGIFRSDDGVTKFFSVNDSGTAAIQDNIMVMDHASGNVGIGTPNSGTYKLAVNGTIRAKEVKVETNWSDFVFEDNYKLPTLDKVESFIKENKHLPDVPSAKQVEEEGLSMSQMMAKQMQKIEELTLYLIEMKKENEYQSKKIAVLEKQLSQINKRY
jgi:hypothetical protein